MIHTHTHTDRLQATIGKPEYVRIGRCLFKAMMPTWDEAQAQQSAEDDWEQDAKGKPTIDRRGFGESMFQVGSRPAAAGLPSALSCRPRAPTPLPPRAAQLVDLWTTGTDPAEYVQFLDTLLEQATHAPPHHRRAAAPPHHCRTAAPPHRRTVAPPPCAAPLRLRRYTSATAALCCGATPLLHLCSATAQAGDVHARRCARVAR